MAKDALLTRWALEDPPRRLAALQLPLARINDIAADPDGEVIALATSGDAIELRRWDDLSLSGTLASTVGMRDEATSLAYSADGRWLAVGGMERVLLLDRATGLIVTSLDAEQGVPSLAFDASSRLLASAGISQGGGYVSVERVGDGREWAFLRALEDVDEGSAISFPYEVAFSPDGRRLAVVHNYTTRAALVLFDVGGGRELWRVAFDLRKPRDRRVEKEADRWFGGIAFADDRTVALGTPRGVVLCFEVDGGRRFGRVRVHPDAPVVDLAMDPDRPILWAALGRGGGRLVPVPIGGR